MAGPASSSSFTYDAFLSFRGEDTRFGFTGHLYSALENKGINTFIDDQELGRGKEITPSLLTAIEESKIAIIVLSKNYASSSFCLDELAKIMECVKGKGRLVIPVFYDVDPSDVRKQTGTYGEALAVHENKFKANTETLNDYMERLKRWRTALKQVADLSGYHFKHGDGYEHKFIAKIVEHVSREVRHVALPVIDHLVGLNSHLQKVTSLLDVESNDGVRMVGIHGIGGIGKTTLAVAVYNWIVDRFAILSLEGLCFLENIRDNSNNRGLQYLQKILLSEIVGEKKIKLTSVKQGISMLKQRLQRKKIFLILDDVDQQEQLDALAGKSNWFSPGSRVIITTRDRNLLSRYEDKITYELEELNDKDALELLSWKALKTNKVDPSYMDLLKDVVYYASGLPLALEVIGSNLVGKNIEQWKSALDQYKIIPNKKIQTILKVSFDALEEFEKEIFLDIACCFKGYGLTYVKEILCAHHSVVSLEYGFGVLVEKSLIKINRYGEVTFHDLIQDMGREIVRQESTNRPGEHSRLWLLEEIIQVLEKNMGSDKIKMIHMHYFSKFEKVIKWDGRAFEKMGNLKTLIISEARFSQGVKHLPNTLRVLKWREYPSHSLPPDFYPEGLVILKLSGRSLMPFGFLDNQKFMSLTVLGLGESNIEEIPDISGVPNLEEFTFSHCVNLIKVHESVGFLDKLKRLDAKGCRKLRSFPPIKLTNLAMLELSGCSSLENFPEILGKMENIEEIEWKDTSIKELPSSIKNLTVLTRLIMIGCGMLELPSSIMTLPYLEYVNIEGSKGLRFPKLDEGEDKGSSIVSSKAKGVVFIDCNMSDESLPIFLAWFRNVKYLNLSRSNFTVIPESIQELFSLRVLTLDDCEKLREIRGIPPNIERFFALNCISLSSLSRSMLLNEELHGVGDTWFYLPERSIPKWFELSSRQDSISFWCRNELPTIALCVLVGPTVDFSLVIGFDVEFIMNGNKNATNVMKSYFEVPGQIADHVIVIGQEHIIYTYMHNALSLSEKEWNHVVCRITPTIRIRPIIKQIGMHVIHISSVEDIRFTDPLLHKEEVNIEDYQRMQQNNLASSALETRQENWLSLHLPPAMNSLNDNVNWDPNSITLMPTSSTTSVQDILQMESWSSVDTVVEEIMRIHRSLPPRPAIDEVEGAKALILNVEEEDQARLESIARQSKGPQVPKELFMVMQEMQRHLVHFQSKEQRREALKLLNLESIHSLFDELIQRASKCVSSSPSSSNSDSQEPAWLL